MTNLKWIPAQDDFETTLSWSRNGWSGTMWVFRIPDWTLPAGEYTYAVVEPWSPNMQVVKVTWWTSSPKALIVEAVWIEKANNVNYSAISHPANSIVRISNNYMFWKDIKTAINSKLNPEDLWNYQFSTNEISVTWDVAKFVPKWWNSMVLASDKVLYLQDKDHWPISIDQMIHPAWSGSEIIVEEEDDYDSWTAVLNTAYFTYIES